jgi:hypothetical protein
MKRHHDHPPADTPTPAGTTPAEPQRLEVTHAEMNAAHDSGEAIPFTEAIPWLVRYDNSWWVVYDHGWLRITDTLTATDLDNRASQTPDPRRSGTAMDPGGNVQT